MIPTPEHVFLGKRHWFVWLIEHVDGSMWNRRYRAVTIPLHLAEPCDLCTVPVDRVVIGARARRKAGQ